MKNHLIIYAALLVYSLSPVNLLAVNNIGLAGTGKYGIKSGIIESKYDLFDGLIVGRQIITFDDYGQKVSNYVTSIIKNIPVKSIDISITKGGETFNFNPSYKRVSSHGLFSSPDINFKNITPEIRDEYNLKEMGKEIICGKLCIKYSTGKDKYDLIGHYWVWEGIILKVELVDELRGKIFVVAEKIVENCDVQISTFDVPTDIVFN